MKKVMLLCGLLIALTAVSANAAGVNLRWNGCFGDGTGAINKTSACTSNTGTNVAVGSFILPADLLGVTGIEIVMDLASAGTTLPAWWSLTPSTGCRPASLSMSGAGPTVPVVCADWSSPSAIGGLAAYQLGLYGPNTARIKAGFANATPQDTFGAQEYFGFNMLITNAKTVGTGLCAGCTTPVCIVLNSINVVPGTAAGVKLSGASNGTDSNFITWQGGAGVGSALGNACPAATPTKNATWGSVKSLYR